MHAAMRAAQSDIQMTTFENAYRHARTCSAAARSSSIARTRARRNRAYSDMQMTTYAIVYRHARGVFGYAYYRMRDCYRPPCTRGIRTCMWPHSRMHTWPSAPSASPRSSLPGAGGGAPAAAAPPSPGAPRGGPRPLAARRGPASARAAAGGGGAPPLLRLPPRSEATAPRARADADAAAARCTSGERGAATAVVGEAGAAPVPRRGGSSLPRPRASRDAAAAARACSRISLPPHTRMHTAMRARLVRRGHHTLALRIQRRVRAHERLLAL